MTEKDTQKNKRDMGNSEQENPVIAEEKSVDSTKEDISTQMDVVTPIDTSIVDAPVVDTLVVDTLASDETPISDEPVTEEETVGEKEIPTVTYAEKDMVKEWEDIDKRNIASYNSSLSGQKKQFIGILVGMGALYAIVAYLFVKANLPLIAILLGAIGVVFIFLTYNKSFKSVFNEKPKTYVPDRAFLDALKATLVSNENKPSTSVDGDKSDDKSEKAVDGKEPIASPVATATTDSNVKLEKASGAMEASDATETSETIADDELEAKDDHRAIS